MLEALWLCGPVFDSLLRFDIDEKQTDIIINILSRLCFS